MPIDLQKYKLKEEKKPSLAYRFGRAVAPLGETLGRTLGISYAQKLQEGVDKNTEVLFQNALKLIKDPNVSQERKKMYRQSLEFLSDDIVSQIPELSGTLKKTNLQVLGEAGITAANVLAGGVKVPTGVATGSFQLMPYVSASFLARLPAAAAVGAAFGASAAAQKGKVGKELIKPAITSGAISAGITTAFEAVPYVTRFFKAATKRLGSAISGSGTDVIDRVIQNPEQALKGIREDDVKLLKESAKALREQVSSIHKEAVKAYGDDLADISTKLGKQVVLDKTGINSHLAQKLQQFGVDVDTTKKVFNFTESPFTGSEEKVLKKVFDYVNNWTDTSPEGLNKLAIKIGRLAKAGTQSQELNNIIYSTKSSIREYLGSQIPEISQMNADYANKMGFVEALKNELSTKGAIDSPAGIVKTSRKIANIFGNNKELARELIEKLEGGTDIISTEAGRQIAKPVAGASVSLKYLLQAIIPPKVVGEVAAYSGLAQQKIAPVIEAFQQMEPLERMALLNIFKKDLVK